MKRLFVFVLVCLLVIMLMGAASLVSNSPADAQQPVQLVGPTTLNTGQTTLGTSATLILPARNRNRVGINVLAANNCAFGNSNVTLATGYRLQPTAGATVTLETSAAIYGVCDVTSAISYAEVQ